MVFCLIYLGVDLVYFFLGFLFYECHHMFDLQQKRCCELAPAKHVDRRFRNYVKSMSLQSNHVANNASTYLFSNFCVVDRHVDYRLWWYGQDNLPFLGRRASEVK